MPSLKPILRGWPNVVYANLCFAAFFMETGNYSIGTLASWIVDWPQFELYAMLIVPPLVLVERPMAFKALVVVGLWTAGATALMALSSENALLAMPFLLLFAWSRARSHAVIPSESQGKELLSVLFFLVPSLFASFLAGMVFTGLFGVPIASSAEFHDRELINHLTFRDYVLAAGGFYFIAATAREFFFATLPKSRQH